MPYACASTSSSPNNHALSRRGVTSFQGTMCGGRLLRAVSRPTPRRHHRGVELAALRQTWQWQQRLACARESQQRAASLFGRRFGNDLRKTPAVQAGGNLLIQPRCFCVGLRIVLRYIILRLASPATLRFLRRPLPRTAQGDLISLLGVPSSRWSRRCLIEGFSDATSANQHPRHGVANPASTRWKPLQGDCSAVASEPQLHSIASSAHSAGFLQSLD